ncbi:MAG: hypothetical protein NZO58_09250, partial [Gemmataceae bacterium]|nr:hypothetical protein [Gemmataceae bacterium]
MRDVLKQMNDALAAGRDCVYCAVVDTRGSTPQKAGAAMVVFADGGQAGTLGGGCVEAEVKRQALQALGSDPPAPRLHTFCLDDNYGWDDGLICGGRMTILVDPVSRPTRRPVAVPYYQAFHRLLEAGRGCTEAVVMVGEAEGASPGH